MPACHASHVFIEEIDSAQRSTQAVPSDPLRALLEAWCDHELQWVLQEANVPSLWTQLARHLSGYLATLWLTGALRGEKPEEAFFVRCDQSTMTPEEITVGHLICVVGLASVKPAMFGRYRIKIQLKTPCTSPRNV
jgi:phage tail sheath protein FI